MTHYLPLFKATYSIFPTIEPVVRKSHMETRVENIHLRHWSAAADWHPPTHLSLAGDSRTPHLGRPAAAPDTPVYAYICRPRQASITFHR